MKKGRVSAGLFFLSLALLAAGGTGILAQTSLPLAQPEYLSKLVNNRTEIERCIMVASPDSLAQALKGLELSKVIPESEKLALIEIIRGVNSILYPAPQSPRKAAKGLETNGAFYISSSLKDITKTDSLLLTQLVEASQGRIFPAPESGASILSELMPALAIFRTKDSQTAQTAFSYAERLSAASGCESVIPCLIKARHALLGGDPDKAALLYTSLLESYPDTWPARLALGRVSLDKGRAAEALSFLAPLEESRKADAAFMLSFALALYHNGRFAEAEPYILALLDTDQALPELSMMEAHILLDRNEFIKALPFIDAFGRKDPQNRMYLYLKTIHASSLPRKEDAIKWARKAFQAFPSDPEMMVLLAGALYAGPESGHADAAALIQEAQKLFASRRSKLASGAVQPASPLAEAMLIEAEGKAMNYLLADAYGRQDWFTAARLLDEGKTELLDKSMVATILRKSGQVPQAVDFASAWYSSAPESEQAAEAYLRSLASAAGIGLASAGAPASDVPRALLSMAGSQTGQNELLGLVFSLLSGSYSASLRSYLLFLRGNLLTDIDASIDAYRSALMERPDNVEALVALAQAYHAKGDAAKAQFYIKQAKMLGVADLDLAKTLANLETALAKK